MASLLLTLALIIVGIELWTRWDESQYHAEMQAKYQKHDLCVRKSSNANLIYELIPNKCGANSIGQKDTEHAKEKPDSIFRIAVIGDSVTEGVGVDSENSYPKKLETILNSDSALDQTYEIMKFAVRGYGIGQEVELLKQAMGFNPDLVVWGYVFNDPAHPVYHPENAELGRYFYQPRSYFIHWLERKLFFAAERSKRDACPKEYHARIHCIYQDHVNRNLDRIKELSETNDVPILFTVLPVFEKGGYQNYSLTEQHKDLSNWASARGFMVLDMLESFSQYENHELRHGNEDETWFDPWHPNEFGHELIATKLSQMIKR